jgi:hypothetical protein
VRGNSLNSLELSCNALQHERGERTKAETARNPLIAGLSSGALGEIRTPDPRIRSPMSTPDAGRLSPTLNLCEMPILIACLANGRQCRRHVATPLDTPKALPLVTL